MLKFRLVALVALLECLLIRVALAASPPFVVNWVKPTTFADGTPLTGTVTYQLYIGPSGKEVKFGNPVTSPPYSATSPAPGVNQCAQVTVIANGVESDRSAEACATIPYPKPAMVTSVTVSVKTP